MSAYSRRLLLSLPAAARVLVTILGHFTRLTRDIGASSRDFLELAREVVRDGSGLGGSVHWGKRTLRLVSRSARSACTVRISARGDDSKGGG